jgi:hypothetical protein
MRRMTLKERLHHSIDGLNVDELMVVYDHIYLLEQVKQQEHPIESSVPIEDILELTKSSKSCWSESVRHEREARG